MSIRPWVPLRLLSRLAPFLLAAAVAALLTSVLGSSPPAQSSGLQISMTASTANVNAGDSVTFTITVENTGADEESGVIVDDTLTGPGTIESAVASPEGTCSITSPTDLNCSLGTLPAGGSATIIVEKLAEASVGGVVELPVIASSASASASDSGPPLLLYGAAVAAFLSLLTAAGWYAGRRGAR